MIVPGSKLPEFKTVACVSCHADAATLPHGSTLAKATCDSPGCHVTQGRQYQHGSHAEALAKGEPAEVG